MVNSHFSCLLEDKYFYVTNDIGSESCLELKEDSYRLYGHCFTDNDIIKNRDLTKSEFKYIRDNHEKLSGLFVCVAVIRGKIEIFIDPLVQYPIFYYSHDGILAISNKLSKLSENYYDKPDINYLYDSLIYEAPLRGKTPVNSLKMIQFDDLQEGSTFSSSFENLEIKKTNILFNKEMDYESALSILANNIKNRSAIIANKYNYIECQLSGGIDCRMVASAFLEYDNVYHYCFGLESQDRLCFESLSNKFNLKKCKSIKYFGAFVRNAAYRLRMVDDLNGLKLHVYGGYMNYDLPIDAGGCRLTGYFGEYVGHKLPSAYISPKSGEIVKEPHIEMLPEASYKVEEDYSRPFWEYNSHESRYGGSNRAINQRFYMNNRGPSHFGMHSVADNVHDNSFNLLYDPMAVTVSELSPYNDHENKEGATCIDLMCKLGNEQFALFPYEGRKIPYYRNFDDIPEINCFEKYTFSGREVEDTQSIKYALPDLKKWDLLGDLNKIATNIEILNYKYFDDFFNDYKELSYLRRNQSHWTLKRHQEILCNFLLADAFFKSRA